MSPLSQHVAFSDGKFVKNQAKDFYFALKFYIKGVLQQCYQKLPR